jgi:1,4-dihydroxy-2-naphthoate octaprenyltransferase
LSESLDLQTLFALELIGAMSSAKDKPPRPALWKVWWTAARPHTLTASLSPVIVGCNATLHAIQDLDEGNNFWSLTYQWAWFCMLIQLGTNLHNDYADFVKGADNEKRVGQARATQKGWLTPFQTAMAASGVLGVALLLGVGFIIQIHGSLTETLVMTFIVITSVFNAFAYTGGPWPLGYMGLGDLSIGYYGLGDIFVFLYFGLVATLTLPFLYVCCNPTNTMEVKELMWSLVPYALQVAALAVNIIVVNNLRDRHTDVHANKRTVAVRFGATFCKREYALMVAVAYGLVLWDVYTHNFQLVRLLPLITLPLAWKEMQAVEKKEGGDLNPHVGGTAKVQFLFCILLSIGIRQSA